ncbi:MAG: tetratricopeptide repeat protein [Cyanobacteria bacterium P01_F01_bin.53]
MSRNFTSSLVQLSPGPGLDITVYLALEKKNTRQSQKIDTLKKYVKKYSSGWKKRLELADLLYAAGQWSEAILEYKQVIQKQPQRIDLHIQLGKILQLMFREAEAIDSYQRAIAIAKHNATTQHIKGLIATCRHHKSDAIAAFQAATALAPQNPTHWLALGQVQMDIESPVAALASFEKLLSIEPDDLIGLIYSHDLLLSLGNLPEAQNRLNRAINIAPQEIQTLKRVITHRCRQRKVRDAAGKHTKQLIKTLLTQAPSSPEAHNLLAQYYILRGEKSKGLQIVQSFAEGHAQNPQAWYYYGLCLSDLEQPERAAEALFTAYELSRHNRCDREIYRALCQLLPILGETEQACALINEMLEVFPECWSLWATAGRVFVEHLKENTLGCQYARQGTHLQPQLADAWFCQGRVLALAEEYKAAIESLTRGWQLLAPDRQPLISAAAALWLGESYQKLGQHQTSKAWLQQARQRAQTLLEAHPQEARYWQNKAIEALSHPQISAIPP